MDSERWRRMETLYGDARALPASEREAFIEQASGDDSELRAEVHRLLSASEEVGDRFERLVARAGAAFGGDGELGREPGWPSVPERIGPFRICGLLGEGGMGTVYLGERVDGEFRQRVAIKLLREGTHGERSRRRFLEERQLLADLVHPNIARLLDGGTTEQGEPYLVMELIEGERIDVYCDRQRLDVDERVRLVRRVCAAVDYAHRQRVVHRDLKPANLLVTADGEPKLLDFGIAKLLEDEGAQPRTVTEVWQRALTPEYASPEQVSGDRVTAAADVHALGLLLYRLLAGLSPWAGATIAGGSLQRAVREHEPVPPSRALQAKAGAATAEVDEIAAARRTTIRRLVRQLTPDLDHVVAKALRKDPVDRYASVAELAAELERYLAGQPVAARRADRPYRWRRWGARHRGAMAGVAAALLAAGGYLSHGVWPQRGERGTVSHEATARRAAAVLGFYNLSGEPASEWLSSALEELVATELATGDALRVVPGGEVARARAELGVAEDAQLSDTAVARLARSLDADLLVLGSYGPEGGAEQGRFRIECVVADPSGARLATATATGGEGELLSIVAEIGTKLRGALGAVSRSPGEEGRLSALHPRDPQAARLYAAGLAALHRFDALGARDLLSQAVAAEPAFPLSHAALADALHELGSATQAREESARAFELAGNLPRAERLAVEARHHETAGRWDQAIDTYRTLVTLFPDDPEAFLRLAAVQIGAGRAREALGTLDELRGQIAGIETDPRVALAEAEAAGAVSNHESALAAARRAVVAARRRGASLLVARSLLAQWWSLRTLGRLDEAAQPASEARQLFAAAGDRGGVALALNAQATLLADQGRFAEAMQADLQALETFRQLGDRRHMSWALNNLGRNLRGRGDLSGARRMYEESLALCRDLGDASGTARAETNLGRMLFEAGELAAARELHEDSLRRRREIGEERGVAGAVVNLAVVELAQGRLAEAETGFREAESSFLELGDKQSAAHVADFLGATLLERGDLEAARQARERALLVWQELGSRDAAGTQLAFAELELADGRSAAAAAGLEALLARDRQGDLGGTAALAQALLANARLALGDEPAARRALTEARRPSTRQLVLADRLALAIWTARAEAMLHLEVSHPPTEVAAEARAAGLRGPELEARLVAGELALRRDARAGRQQLGKLAREAETAGYGRIAARARSLLASTSPG